MKEQTNAADKQSENMSSLTLTDDESIETKPRFGRLAWKQTGPAILTVHFGAIFSKSQHQI